MRQWLVGAAKRSPAHHVAKKKSANQCAILIDNTNLCIGGQQWSAERKGVRRAQRSHHRALDRCDPSWRLDLLEYLALPGR
jgi:hypothetical protein